MENTSWLVLVTMAVTLGIRHGFDLDHLGTIDAITRTVRDNRFLSKMVGFLFSLGHGMVVIAMSLILGSCPLQAHIPEWLDGFGQWVSIVFLSLFGILNLYNVFHNQALPVGIKSFLAKRLCSKKFSPALILSIGALFAFSFDTFSQIALFSISASLVSGWLFSGMVGFFFMLGMMVSDGINGLLVSTLIQRADGVSVMVSRGLGLTISLFSLGLGIMSLVQVLSTLR